ncbi:MULTISPECIES: ABC transporter ATP-binding protein [Gordonia]|uniref:ABC transporter ATP-binding protein n=1 Tax=Gordonia amicalis TaxID=89053 RepID=A0AAE4R5N0_9ACTN|nr:MULTISPECIES: ABC transporter ATP-binding protein [Gordonia]ATD71028.1 ABC transporter ATP-binding protein [Gordonia sp. 1D]KAF0969816.1 Multidrug efflux system ATP-binding protein [Gordonia sp. YY1]MCZ0913018.1 ABC transporter ATP-binding protein [Gordonia amicalis]MCZ4579629.1 ABC transporter ATP-binding protein [Gordonia amicalis]MDJ0453126.1 ABC transporter ATP-binding protein [Gordonia amicalis]
MPVDTSDLVIDARGLRKSFGRFEALRGLDLGVRRGEVHGFLGPNGAGKSTTIRVLLGLLRANAGEVRILGGDPWRDVVELHRRLAYVPGDVALWPSMTGGEMIDLLGSMRGGLDEDRRADLVRRFELDTTKRGRQYSKGNRQKVAIVAALASEVELLILDEPTSGLDPLMENVFQEVVGEAKSRGTTVLLSSHILAEVETLADRLSIIRDGVIVAAGTLSDLRGHTRTSVRAELETIPSEDRLGELHEVDIDGQWISATVDSDRIGAAMEVLTSCGLRSLTVEPPSLESLFLRLYGSEDSTSGKK